MTKGGSKQIKSNKNHDENQSNGDFELQNFVDVQKRQGLGSESTTKIESLNDNN
jgi:hypothetical protein